jgi:uncharacterized protein YbjT (DUF2867 family)
VKYKRTRKSSTPKASKKFTFNINTTSSVIDTQPQLFITPRSSSQTHISAITSTMSTKSLLVVFGATGNQGGSIAHFVLDDPELSKRYAVRAITRDTNNPKAQALAEKGAELVQADLGDESSLPAALKGANFVFAITTTQYQGNSKPIETAQAKALCSEALKQGAGYIIWSSMSHPFKISNGKLAQVEHFDVKAEIETYIRSLPIKSSFYAPGSFMQNFYTSLAPRPSWSGDGTYVLASLCNADTLLPMIDITDTGKFVGAILAEPDKYEGKFFAAAEGLYSYTQMAEALSKATGKEVKFQKVDDETFKTFLPEGLREQLCEMMVHCRDYGYYGENMKEDVKWASEQAKGHLTTLEEFLTRENFKLE